MLRLAADENFNSDIVRGLVRRKPDVDIVRVQDVGLSGADDPTILEWAAREGRVVVKRSASYCLDAFAWLAWLQDEPGAAAVQYCLP